MAADLNALRDTLLPPDGFSIARADTPAALDVWRDTLCTAFGLPLAGGQAWIDATLAFGIERAPWRHYTGFLNGAPVATSFSFNGGGVVGLFCIAVMPEARGKGIGAAITRQPLLDARADGMQVGVLFASPLGAPVYRRLGFRDVGSRISRYGWVDPDAGANGSQL
jgi:ribosomal protein S18 acetylase RimI-like enzyme